jgi:hypothetical protein
MMKVSNYAMTMALLTHAGRRATAQTCSGVVSSFSGECTYDNFKTGLANSGCQESELFPNSTDNSAAIAELCAYDAPTQFVELNQYYQDDRMFFIGGGKLAWDADYAQASADLDRFATNAGDKTVIAYPDYYARVKYNQQNDLGDNGQPPNLNIDTQCDQNTIMCCYTDDSKDEAFPADKTTDVCYNDLANNREANFITNGWSVFPGSETSTYCLGFTWSEADQDSDLLGNAMYGISYRTVETKGYLGAIPGAPLCGCSENMPVVEKADCLTASVNGDVTYKFTLEADGALSAANEATIDYTDCGDLKTASEAAGNAGIGSYLVGDGGCAAATDDFLNEEELSSLGTSERSVAIDHTVWSELFVGEGTYFQPPGLDRAALDVEFRALVDAGCWDEKDDDGNPITRPCIVRRECNSCSQPSHRHIYYKRHTAIPDASEFNLVDYFMNQFTYESPNMHGEDFDLYSTYEDAIAGTNAWEYCQNRNYWGIGFPYECGPNGRVYNQYNSYEARKNWGHANHHGYFVELVKAL